MAAGDCDRAILRPFEPEHEELRNVLSRFTVSAARDAKVVRPDSPALNRAVG